MNAVSSDVDADPTRAPEGDDDDADGIAPRPRPGFKSSEPRLTGAEKAQLGAGLVRAGAGLAGFSATLLYVPITMATPVLAGVSLLMIVTGCTSTWRSIRPVRFVRPWSLVPRAVIACSGVVVAATLVLTWTLGAGSFGPLAQQEATMSHTSPVISFEPPPSKR